MLWSTSSQALLVFEDISGKLTPEQVITQQQNQFIERENGFIDGSQSVWWVKASLHNPQNSSSESFIKFDHGLIEQVDAYYFHQGELIEQRNGFNVPISQRSFHSIRNIFDFDIAANQDLDIYFRVQTRIPITLNYEQFSYQTIIDEISQEGFQQALALSCMFVVLLYGLFNLVVLHDPIFKIYLAFIAANLGYSLCEFGWLTLTPTLGQYSLVIFSLVSGSAYILGIQFLRQLFNDISSLWISRAADAVSVLVLLHLALLLVDATLPLRMFFTFSGLLVFLGYVVVLVTAMKHKHYLASWVLLPWAVVMLSSFVYWLQWNGWFESYSQWPAYAAAFESVMLAGVVAVRVKKREKQLIEKLAFQGFIENLGSDFIAYRHLLDGEFVWVSGNTQAVFGVSTKDILGRKLTEFLAFDEQNIEKLKALKVSLLKGNKKNQNHTEIFDFSNAQGDIYLSLEIYAHIVLDVHNNVFAIEGICQDVTDRESIRRETVELKNKLEERIFYQNQMFSVISHELRTPLSSTKMLYDEMRIDYNLPYGPTLRDNNESLLAILDSLKIVVNPAAVTEEKARAVSPAMHIERAVLSINHLFTDNDFTLHFTHDKASQQFMLINSNSLRQIVLNITKNALLHSGGNNLWIDVSALPVSNRKSKLSIVIEDDGKGIDAKKQKRMFEPFVRGETKADGSGLGLFIINNLVNYLEGSVEYFTSQHGGAGWRFTFVFDVFVDRTEPLELDIVQTQTTDENPASKPIASIESYYLAGKSILFAEDQLTIQMLSKRMFEKQGATVAVANDGLEALDHFAKQVPDLVVTDVMMPNKNGYELCADLRNMGYQGLIVAVTAATIGDEKDLLLQAGANIVLPKPLVIQDLVNSITEFLASVPK